MHPVLAMRIIALTERRDRNERSQSHPCVEERILENVRRSRPLQCLRQSHGSSGSSGKLGWSHARSVLQEHSRRIARHSPLARVSASSRRTHLPQIPIRRLHARVRARGRLHKLAVHPIRIVLFLYHAVEEAVVPYGFLISKF